jgi:hypothetical protein
MQEYFVELHDNTGKLVYRGIERAKQYSNDFLIKEEISKKYPNVTVTLLKCQFCDDIVRVKDSFSFGLCCRECFLIPGIREERIAAKNAK